DPEKMPRLDGAEAAYPIYAAFAAACYDNIGEIQTAEKGRLSDADKHFATYRRGGTPVCFTNTIEAFKGLVSGDVDIFFGARPSAEQQKLAEDAGKTLVLTPIGKEAFVFMVSDSNPVDGLSSEQIRAIYSGEYTNWISVGGLPAPILAFQRPENSGSQTMMKYFMGDTPLKEPVKGEYYSMMEGVIRATASYQNKLSSIGYSFRYYTMGMSDEGGEGIKLLALDGIYPDAEHISSGEYPMTTALYAITLAENDNEYIAPMLEWMTGEQGQEIVEKTGYVALG
ncbi:MAG: PstS family phosphate ABC transporter substrate-binding protein, partial [Oscillospiraceae bacterium]